MTLILTTILIFLISWILIKVIHLPLDMDEQLRDKIKGKSLLAEESLCVLIPVRNEERKIRDCLQSVFAQTFHKITAVVVNDGSTDGTAGILRAMQAEVGEDRLKVFNVLHTPDGWTGKNYALKTGLDQIGEEHTWVLQIDGDVVLSPQAVEHALIYMQNDNVTLLSLLSRLILLGVAEKVFQAMVPLLALALCRVKDVNDPAKDKMFLNGQFILYRRQALIELGGYAKFSNVITDDIAIGNLFKRAGLRTRLLYGQEYVATRMYDSAHSIWRGWSKFLYNGLFKSMRVSMAVCAVVTLVFILPFCLALLELVRMGVEIINGMEASFGAVYVLSMLVFAMVYFAVFEIRKRLGTIPYWSYTYPVGAAFFVALLLSSSLSIEYGRGVSWKGRSYFDRKRPNSGEFSN